MGKKILLADDSITIQKVIELTFSDEDFEVVTVGNGRLAIEKALEFKPDLMLCDVIMPEKDGYEVCEFIKQNEELKGVPVLLLTGAFEPFDQGRADKVGADGSLAKPFEPQALVARVKELLSGAPIADASHPMPAGTTPEASPASAGSATEERPMPTGRTPTMSPGASQRIKVVPPGQTASRKVQVVAPTPPAPPVEAAPPPEPPAAMPPAAEPESAPPAAELEPAPPAAAPPAAEPESAPPAAELELAPPAAELELAPPAAAPPAAELEPAPPAAAPPAAEPEPEPPVAAAEPPAAEWEPVAAEPEPAAAEDLALAEPQVVVQPAPPVESAPPFEPAPPVDPPPPLESGPTADAEPEVATVAMGGDSYEVVDSAEGEQEARTLAFSPVPATGEIEAAAPRGEETVEATVPDEVAEEPAPEPAAAAPEFSVEPEFETVPESATIPLDAVPAPEAPAEDPMAAVPEPTPAEEPPQEMFDEVPEEAAFAEAETEPATPDAAAVGPEVPGAEPPPPDVPQPEETGLPAAAVVEPPATETVPLSVSAAGPEAPDEEPAAAAASELDAASAMKAPPVPEGWDQSTVEVSLESRAKASDESRRAHAEASGSHRAVSDAKAEGDDLVDRVTAQVVERLSDGAIRDIAWEVVPELAEKLIRAEIERLKAEIAES